MSAITAKTVAGAKRPGAGDVGGTKDANWASKLSGANRDAFVALNNLFKSYGLQSLAPKIFEYVQKGYSSDTISILLQETPEYKKRFAGNEERLKAGLPVLSPADYLNLENQYRQELREGGMPTGFYDSTSDFADLIGKDVSPSELQSRISIATNAATLSPPAYKDALKSLYGVGDSQIAAYFLDPDKALPVLQKQASAAAIGAEALKAGLSLDRSHLEAYATAGVSAQQAAQAYQQIAQDLPGLKEAGSAFGENVSQFEEEQAAFGQVGPVKGETAAAKISRLESWNRARAQGAAGAAASGLAANRSGTV